MTPTMLSVERVLGLLAEHVWQSTAVALCAAVLAVCYRRHAARVRYAIWLTASLKFLVPIALLTVIGQQLPWRPVDVVVPSAISTAWSLGQPFASSNRQGSTPTPSKTITATAFPIVPVVLAVWLTGSIIVGMRRLARWRAASALRRASQPIEAGREADVFRRHGGTSSPLVELRRPLAGTSPGVVGVVRPVLLWPDELSSRLTDSQIDAIVTHELGHVRARHNLVATVHAVVETLFWFHPLAWHIGAKLVDERERACDELVLEAGVEPEHYADALLQVGEFSVGRPAIAAGITGSRLIHRIEAIMAPRTSKQLGWRQKTLLFSTCGVLVLGPVVAGVLSADTRQATGRIAGVVTDQSGATIEGVTVTVRSSTGAETRVRTDAAGRFALDSLPSGDYEVRYELPGFAPRVITVTVREGQITEANAPLSLGQVRERISIRPPIAADASPSSLGTTTEIAGLSERLGPALPYLEEAASLYRQEQFAESMNALAHGLDLIESQAASDRPTAPRMVAQSGGQIDPPRKIRDLKPIYPSTARAMKAAGSVVIEARIAEDGTIRDATVQQSVPGLDEAALGAVRQWLYTPVTLNGVPTSASVTITVSFDAPGN